MGATHIFYEEIFRLNMNMNLFNFRRRHNDNKGAAEKQRASKLNLFDDHADNYNYLLTFNL